MMHAPLPRHPDDATLVHWLDGELDAREASSVARAVAADPTLDARARLLRTARDELALAFDDERAPSTGRRAFGHAARRLGIWLCAAAALTVVVTIATTNVERAAVAQNDWLSLRLACPKPGWDLFTGVRFELEGRARTDTPCRVIARRKDEGDAQLAARASAENGGADVVPLVLEAVVEGPDGTVGGEVARVDGTFGTATSSLVVELIDVRASYPGIAPLLTVRLDDDGAAEDFSWGFGRGVAPDSGTPRGVVVETPGEYRLRLRARALPTTAGGPAFAEPLEVAIGFAVRGVVGAWSEPVDGMSARIVASRDRVLPEQPLAVALQLRNDSDRPRGYNITGRTLARIPQPLHFDLLVDDQPWQQRDGLGVVTAAAWTFLPQPVGTLRSMVVLTDYWHQGGTAPSDLSGAHRLAFRFHFEPSVWQAGDPVLWMGKIDTPAIAVGFGPGR